MARTVTRASLITLVVCAASGCGRAPTPSTVEETIFDAGLSVNLSASTRLDGGEYVRDLEVGTGIEVVKDQTISIRYEGALLTGEVFDSNFLDGGIVTFVVGKSQVIAGLDQGVEGMKRGGTRQMLIPPGLAYGVEAGAPPAVPPNSVVVFLVQVQPQTTGSPPGCGCTTGVSPPLIGMLVLIAFAVARKRRST
jgi:MYXO-CTERM domain-containing protein